MSSVIWFKAFTVTTLHAQQTNTSGADLSSRIWYGERANIKDYPFYANIGHCGATILSEWWLATAAHCATGKQLNYSGKKVWVGEDGVLTRQPYTFNEVIIHPKYGSLSNQTPVNDIALLKLTRPLTFNNNVKPIRLPRREYGQNVIYAVAGRGGDETGKPSTHLMTINVRSLDFKKCLPYFSSSNRIVLNRSMDLVDKVTICTIQLENKPGVCHGDSGSPLVKGDSLVGIASYINGNCFEARLGMYTNVFPFVGWIKGITGIQ